MPTRLLVVDDEPDMESLCRQKFRRPIRSGDLQFTFVSNGLEALRALEEEPDTDVVLTDLNMPEMDGLGLLGRIQELGLPLRTVVVSAYGDMHHIRAAMNRGAFDFLTKPIDFADLDTTVQKTIRFVGEIKAGIEAKKRITDLEARSRFVRDVFGRYVPEQVVARLLDAPEGLRLGGERRDVTTMMVDVRGFTSLSERLDPEAVVALLNRYFAIAVECIHRHGGTVNEILGDGLLVFFGAPIAIGDAAKSSIAAAIELQTAMDRFNQEIEADGLPRLSVGIGIHTGPAVVGNIGSERRMKYTAVGSSVNLACRIESHTLGGQILISESTWDQAMPDVRARRFSEIKAKGFSSPVWVYEVRGLDGDLRLSMPARTDDRCCMPTAVAVDIHCVRGKSVSDEAVAGECLRLSGSMAILRSEQPPPPWSNVKLVLRDEAGRARAGECYGKVDTESVDSPGAFVVRFTYADAQFLDSVAEVLRGVLPDVLARRTSARSCEDRTWCRACETREDE